MAKFKLLAGKHVAADVSQDPLPVYDAATGAQKVDVRTGKPVFKHPPRVYKAGQTVECDDDLVARFGANKFQLISGTPGKGPGVSRRAAQPAESAGVLDSANPAVAPGGQVSSGFQQTTGVEGDPDGRTQVAGPLDVEDEATAEASGADLENRGGKDTPAGYDRDELNDLSVADLKELAASDEVELHGASRKADIIDAILKAKKK